MYNIILSGQWTHRSDSVDTGHIHYASLGFNQVRNSQHGQMVDGPKKFKKSIRNYQQNNKPKVFFLKSLKPWNHHIYIIYFYMIHHFQSIDINNFF